MGWLSGGLRRRVPCYGVCLHVIPTQVSDRAGLPVSSASNGEDERSIPAELQWEKLVAPEVKASDGIALLPTRRARQDACVALTDEWPRTRLMEVKVRGVGWKTATDGDGGERWAGEVCGEGGGGVSTGCPPWVQMDRVAQCDTE